MDESMKTNDESWDFEVVGQSFAPVRRLEITSLLANCSERERNVFSVLITHRSLSAGLAFLFLLRRNRKEPLRSAVQGRCLRPQLARWVYSCSPPPALAALKEQFLHPSLMMTSYYLGAWASRYNCDALSSDCDVEADADGDGDKRSAICSGGRGPLASWHDLDRVDALVAHLSALDEQLRT
jgi:hypothetical protein